MAVATPHHASLAILPFGGERGVADDYFSRGFVEDLITELSRFANLAVIAWNSSKDPRAAELATDFVLTGSLRREGSRLRITAQLVETASDSVLWSNRFDHLAEDVFGVQDEICSQVVAQVSDRIHVTLTAAARRKSETDLVAYDYWLQGIDELKQGTPKADERARALFEEALGRDPNYARAYVGLSLSHFNEWSCQLWQSWDDNERLAHDYAVRALTLDGNDHYAQLVLGRVLLYRREFERASHHLERAFTLNENDADSLVQLALGMTFLGDATRARTLFERARYLNPFHGVWYYAYGGIVAFAQHRFEEALAYLGRVAPDTMVDLSAYLAVAHGRLGRPEQARASLDRYLEEFQRKISNGRAQAPGDALRWLQHTNPYRNPADEDRLIDGVRTAGLQVRDAPLVAATPNRCAFQKVGSVWQLSYGGRDVCLPHVKGLADIALLLAIPERPLHCSELMGLDDQGSAAEAIDPEAKRDYEARMRELEQDLQEVESNNDPGRAASIRAELDFLVEHVRTAFGLGGRSRKLGAPTERARSAVTQRIRAALKRIEVAHEALGRHLSTAIQTGAFCVYRPERSQDWHL